MCNETKVDMHRICNKSGNRHRNLKFSFILSFLRSDIHYCQFMFSCSCVMLRCQCFLSYIISIDSKLNLMCHSIQMYHRHFAEGVKVVQHIRSAKIEIVGLKPQFHISGTAVELPPVQKHYRMPKSFVKHVLLYYFTKLWFFIRIILYFLL